MSREEIIRIQYQFIDAVNQDKLEKLNALVSPNVIDHDPVEGQVPGPQGYIRFFRTLRSAFPDMNVSSEQMIADDEDSVGFAYTFSGTHKGRYQGIPATGQQIQIRGMQISRFRQGKMTERWGNWDESGILKQLSRPTDR